MSSSHSGSKYGQDPPSCSRAHLTQLVPAEVTSEFGRTFLFICFFFPWASIYFVVFIFSRSIFQIHQLRASKDAAASTKET